MGVGDAIRKQISNLVNNPSKVLGDKANSVVKDINSGGKGLEEAEKLMVSALNLFSASSNDILVRVEFS